jgi:hypothetical protein
MKIAFSYVVTDPAGQVHIAPDLESYRALIARLVALHPAGTLEIRAVPSGGAA